jgi:hypothetical protein
MKSKQTLKTSTNKCEGTECLVVDIYESNTKYTYNVFRGQFLVGQLIEDDIMKILTKKEINAFYKNKQERFLVCSKTLRDNIVKPKIK